MKTLPPLSRYHGGMQIGSADSSLPMHIARAYQLAPSGSIKLPNTSAQTQAPAQPLAAAQVAGPVSFDTPKAQPASGVLAMYTNPAHRNAAATGVELGAMGQAQLGRMIDAQG